MPSVFTNSDEQTWNGSFRADDLVMSFAGGGDGAGALVQQAQWNIQRAVNMLYEIGSANIYYVGNRRNGTITLNRVIGSSGLYEALINQFGDMCSPSNFELTSQFGCGSGGRPGVTTGGAQGSRTWTMQYAIMTRIGASVTAQDITINETIDFMFSDMLINGGGGAGG